MNPAHEANAGCEMFCFAAITDCTEDTIYSDLAGKFPIRSFKGNQYIFICYVYGQNAILVRPMKTREITSLLKAFTSIYEYLKGKKLKPKL